MIGLSLYYNIAATLSVVRQSEQTAPHKEEDCKFPLFSAPALV